MQENTENTKIIDCCPSGHRVRGDISLSGNTVRCPRCQSEFVFAPMKPKAGATNSAVTDTGVMRILGDTPDVPQMPERKEVTSKVCPRCQLSISANSTVCDHCNCYVGVMPRFMSQLTGGDSGTIGKG